MAEPENEPKVVEIHCPACRSTITSDGKNLVAKSADLTKTEKKAQECDTIAADNADLRIKLATLKQEVADAEKTRGTSPAPAAPARRFRFSGE